MRSSHSNRILKALLILTCFWLTAARIPKVEVDALLDLYRSTNGPRWRRNKWPDNILSLPLQQLRPCRWRGVSCRGKHVLQLSLEHSLAGGTLPASLSNLHHLVVLDLGSNRLRGPLPAEWGAGLKRAIQIELDGNHFNGTIPETWEGFLERGRGPSRDGAAAGGSRVFLGFTSELKKGVSMDFAEMKEPPHGAIRGYGFACPYPAFLLKKTEVTRDGKRVEMSNIATSWGLPLHCGLADHDRTPDEEAPVNVDQHHMHTLHEDELEL